MKEFSYQIKSEYGMHARPAGRLVRLVKKYDSKVTISCGDKTVPLRDILPLMGMGIRQDDTVTIQADGPDEEACIAEISAFLPENV